MKEGTGTGGVQITEISTLPSWTNDPMMIQKPGYQAEVSFLQRTGMQINTDTLEAQALVMLQLTFSEIRQHIKKIYVQISIKNDIVMIVVALELDTTSNAQQSAARDWLGEALSSVAFSLIPFFI